MPLPVQWLNQRCCGRAARCDGICAHCDAFKMKHRQILVGSFCSRWCWLPAAVRPQRTAVDFAVNRAPRLCSLTHFGFLTHPWRCCKRAAGGTLQLRTCSMDACSPGSCLGNLLIAGALGPQGAASGGIQGLCKISEVSTCKVSARAGEW